VPTRGRETLTRTLASLTAQIGDGDEILVVRDHDAPWGNKVRDKTIPRCAGSHIWFMDDDDVAAEGALEAIRSQVGEQPDLIHVFRMRYADGYVLWGEPNLHLGNVGTPMMVVPNVPGKIGRWDLKADGGCNDFYFLEQTVGLQGGPVVWHEQIVAEIRPDSP